MILTGEGAGAFVRNRRSDDGSFELKTGLVACVAGLVFALASGGPAAAVGARAVEPVDLGSFEPKRAVVDRVLDEWPAGAETGTPQVFFDQHGHRITLDTAIPGLDLSFHARVLAATLHYNEIEDLVVFVVGRVEIGTVCGHPAALGCYLPADPASSRPGYMWVSDFEHDLVHTIVHEYGHHVDTQLLNLGHLGGECDFSGDGSRNWFFARALHDDILGRGFNCSPDTQWDLLLAELFAEDYAQLNGITGWDLANTAAPPTSFQKSRLAYDFAHPFSPRTLRMSRFVRFRRIAVRRFRADDWTFFSAFLTGPRRADLDLFLFRRGGRRPIAKSTRLGSRERIKRIPLRPGRYHVVVYAYAAGGRARLRVGLE